MMNKKAQGYPLYAVTPRGHVYLVVGWTQSASTSNTYPIVAPLTKFGLADYHVHPLQYFVHRQEALDAATRLLATT